MSNGCGCESGWLKWFRPPYSQLFYAACCVHDDDYDRGGTEYDRECADYGLHQRMLAVIERGQYGRIKTLWLRMWAWLYLRSVRAFGSEYFNYHQ